MTSLCSCCGTNVVYCGGSGDLGAGGGEGRELAAPLLRSPWPRCRGAEQHLLCMGHMSEFTRGFVSQGKKHHV